MNDELRAHERRLLTQGRSDEPVVREGGGFVIAIILALAMWAFVALVLWSMSRSAA